MAGPFVQAFLGGAATTLTENIKRDEKIAREEEKNARELAATQASLLIENHTKVKDAREKQATKTKEDALFLKAQFPTVSNDDLVLAATNPESPIAKFIEKRGEGIHHIAFDVTDIDAEIARLQTEGFELINKTSKPGADNKLIAFL